MKQLTFLLAIIGLLLSGNVSLAQGRLLEGKVVDSMNKPVWGAIIRISKQGKLVTAIHSGNDGVFHSEPMDEGNYDIEVITDNKTVAAKKMFFNAEGGIKKYYLLKTLHDRVEISKVGERAFNELDLRGRGDIEQRHKR